MLKVERPSGIVVQYKWKLTDIKRDITVLSKKIHYKENESFRIGLKNSPVSSPSLVFVTTNLNKIGLKASSVSFSSSNHTRIKPMELKIGRKADEDGTIQLFTSSLQPVGDACSFTFTVQLTGIVENYRVSSIDRLLSQQLWLSNQDGTDFELIAKDGKSFPVHKWILAARSPVFATLFGNEESEPNYCMDCTVDEIQQFVKFVYTGEFEEPVTSYLTRLTVEYQ